MVKLSHDLFFILSKNKTNCFVCSEMCFIMGLSRKLNYKYQTMPFDLKWLYRNEQYSEGLISFLVLSLYKEDYLQNF